jgi:hypothetical protein
LDGNENAVVRAFPLVILIVLAASGEARAQFQTPEQQAQCQLFVTIRDEVQKRGQAVQAAFKRKATPQEACGLIKTFAENEAKMVKFVETNGVWCGFPPDAIKQLKASQARTAQAQTNACNAAAAPKPLPAPTLGDALGTTRVPDASNTRTGRGGVYDTLNGNPIAR